MWMIPSLPLARIARIRSAPLWLLGGLPCLAGDTVVIDTNQVQCYDDQGEIADPAPGAPFFGQDAQIDGVQPAYLDNGDGTVTDLETGLIWQQSVDFDTKRTWDEAMAYADSLVLAGFDDWRAPTVKELYSLMDYRGSSVANPPVPCIDTDFFDFQYPDPSSGDRPIDVQFWSRDIYVGTTMSGFLTGFGVNFADGRIKGYPAEPFPNGTVFARYVRCVRGGSGYGENEFVDNLDGTVTDHSTGLMWAQHDSLAALDWAEALDHADGLLLGGHDDWRLPNAKELQSIVDYTRAPDATDPARQGPAIDPVFDVTETESWCWTGTTLDEEPAGQGSFGVYICFGQAFGWMEFPPMSGNWTFMNVHGAGSQRSDPKSGDPADYPLGHGPQGDEVRIFNYVRCVRDVEECTGGVATYCTAKTTSSGCTPSIGASGLPSAGAASGFTVTAAQVERNQFGILFYGTSGAATTPFQGGTLCVQTPIVRTPVQHSGSGGVPPCEGILSLDLNAEGISAAIGEGNSAWMQGWFRDPPDAHGSGLTDGVTFTVCP